MCIFCSIFARFFGRMGLESVKPSKLLKLLKQHYINSLCWAVVAQKGARKVVCRHS